MEAGLPAGSKRNVGSDGWFARKRGSARGGSAANLSAAPVPTGSEAGFVELSRCAAGFFHGDGCGAE